MNGQQKLVRTGAVALVLTFAIGSRAAASEIPAVEAGDNLRCRSAVSTVVANTRDQVVACYFDVTAFDENPGEYTLSGSVGSTSGTFAYRGSGGYTWCNVSGGAVMPGTLYVGPTFDSVGELGRELLAGQLVIVRTYNGWSSGSCEEMDPDPGSVCIDDTGASASDTLSIDSDAAGIVFTPHDPISYCPGEEDFGAEWVGEVATFDGGDWFDEYFDTNTAFPQDWFPGSVVGNETPPGICGEISPRFRINGEVVSGPEAEGMVGLPTDTIELEIELPDGYEPSDFHLSVRARPSDDYLVIESYTGAVLATAPVGQLIEGRWRYDVSELYDVGVTDLTTFELRCFVEGGPVVYWSPNSTLCADVMIWCNQPNINRACFGLSVLYPPKAEVQVDDSVRFGYVMAPGPFEGDDPGVTALTAHRQGSDEEYEVAAANSTSGAANGGPGFDALFMAGEEGFFLVVSQWDTNNEFIYFVCTDSFGTVTFDPSGRPIYDGGCVPADCGVDTESCFESSSIGLAPSSWVPGAGRMIVCLVKALAIPRSGFVGEWASDTKERLEDVPPFSFGLAVVDFGQNVADEVEDPSGTGCYDVGIPVAGDDEHEACVSAAGVTTSGGQRALIALAILVPLYLGLLMRGVQLLRSK